MFRNIIIVLGSLLILSVTTVYAQKPDVLLDRAERSLKKSTTKVQFQSTQYSAQGKPLSTIDGLMYLQGERFRMEYGALTAVFVDGILSYYDRESHEFTLTEPSQDDLMALNPFYFVRMRAKGYQITSFTSRDATLRGLRLKPQMKTAVQQIDILVKPDTGLPKLVHIYIADGTRSEIKITSIQTLSTIAPSLFTLSSKSYPGCEIVDLR